MGSVSEGFTKRSNDVLKGAIGAINGWLVRVCCPSWFLDRLTSPIMFFSWKVFFALNVQCIIDDNKEFFGPHTHTREPIMIQVAYVRLNYIADLLK